MIVECIHLIEVIFLGLAFTKFVNNPARTVSQNWRQQLQILCGKSWAEGKTRVISKASKYRLVCELLVCEFELPKILKLH